MTSYVFTVWSDWELEPLLAIEAGTGRVLVNGHPTTDAAEIGRVVLDYAATKPVTGGVFGTIPSSYCPEIKEARA